MIIIYLPRNIPTQMELTNSINKNEEKKLNLFRRVAEDNCPWPIIASLALSRMYESWQLQGYTVPKVNRFASFVSSLHRDKYSVF